MVEAILTIYLLFNTIPMVSLVTQIEIVGKHYSPRSWYTNLPIRGLENICISYSNVMFSIQNK